MIKIKAKYYYYSGICHPLKSGFLKDEIGRVLKFNTAKDACDYLIDFYGKMDLVAGKATYANSGIYTLNYGEYSRPLYTLVREN